MLGEMDFRVRLFEAPRNDHQWLTAGAASPVASYVVTAWRPPR
jgi:hypothetical protein